MKGWQFKWTVALLIGAVVIGIVAAGKMRQESKIKLQRVSVKRQKNGSLAIEAVVPKRIKGLELRLIRPDRQVRFFYNQTPGVFQGAVPMGFALSCDGKSFESLGVEGHLIERDCNGVALDPEGTSVREGPTGDLEIQWSVKTPKAPRRIEIRDPRGGLIVTLRPYREAECVDLFRDLSRFPVYDDREIFDRMPYLRKSFVQVCMRGWRAEGSLASIKLYDEEEMRREDPRLGRWLKAMRSIPRSNRANQRSGCRVTVRPSKEIVPGKLRIVPVKLNKERARFPARSHLVFDLPKGYYRLEIPSGSEVWKSREFDCWDGVRVYLNLDDIERGNS